MGLRGCGFSLFFSDTGSEIAAGADVDLPQHSMTFETEVILPSSTAQIVSDFPGSPLCSSHLQQPARIKRRTAVVGKRLTARVHSSLTLTRVSESHASKLECGEGRRGAPEKKWM